MSKYSGSTLNLTNKNTNWYKAFNLIKEKSSVLDIGCSNGTFGYELTKKKKCVVDGIEINKNDAKEAAKVLRKVHNLNVETDSLSDVNEKFDYIFMGDVIEHFVKPIESLKKIKSLLRDNGSIVFSIPNMLHMSVRLMFLEGKIEYGETGLLDKTHLHFYNKNEIARVFAAAGYSIKNLDYSSKPLKNEQIKKVLNDLGLNAKPKFNIINNNEDAIAYQYVGLAVPARKVKAHDLKFRSPEHINLFDEYVNEELKSYKIKIDSLKNEIQILNKKLKEVNAIKETKYWKIYSYARAFKNLPKK